MHIDRHNYETYFLLYTDNELSVADRHGVERFVEQNPDLKPELDLLQQYTFTPDLQQVFGNKEALLKTTGESHYINHDNYTTCFLLYADDELSASEKAAVEQFADHHPALKKEFEWICAVKLVPDETATFHDKALLYRHEKSLPAVLRWWQVAAAAVIVLIAGALWQRMYKQPALQVVVARQQPAHRANGQNAPATGHAQTQQAGTPPLPLHEAIALATQRPLLKEARKAVTSHRPSAIHPVPAAAQPAHDAWAASAKRSIHPSDISTHIIPSYPATPVDAAIGADAPAITRLARQDVADEKISTSTLADDAPATADNQNEDVLMANISVQRNGTLRGLFRKASRYINKTTALTSVRKPGIHIGNIAIAFQ